MPFPNEIAEINLSSGQDGGQEISKIAILDEPRGYLACPARFERATYALEGRCSIQLSYGQIETRIAGLKNHGRGERIRTFDPLLPKQMRYQAALRPD